MELRQYASLLLKWLWLIVIGTVLAGGAAFLISRATTPVYQSSTTLMLIPGSNPSIMDYNAVLTGQELTKTYGELLKKRPVLEGAIAALHLSMTAEELARLESIQLVQNTQLIVLNIQNEDPVLAAKLANQIALVFIDQNQSNQTSRFASSKENLQVQIKQLETALATTQTGLDQARNATPPNTAEVTRLEASLSEERTSYSNLVKSYEDIRIAEAQAIDTVAVVEPAITPDTPIRPNVRTNTLLAAAVGAMLAVGVAFLVEYLDDRIHTPEQVEAFLHLVTLGNIQRNPVKTPEDRLIVQRHPRSTISEAYRALRTNIQFANVDHPPKTILVTSASPLEGKSTTAANLAAAIAQGGQSVALVDTDLRRPVLHRVFEVPGFVGLTTALVYDPTNLNGSAQQTKVEHLQLIPTGPLPPNPAELLGSKRMQQFIETLKRQYDVLIFDSPPVLAVTDALVLAPHIDAVILVVDAGQTRHAVALDAVKALNQVGANVIGVVLNKLTAKHSGYYYYHYYSADGRKEKIHHDPEKAQVPPEPLISRN